MECPVCKTTIDSNNQNQCPGCSTDMEIFYALSRIERKSLKQKGWIAALSLLLLLVMVGVIAYYFLTIIPIAEYKSSADLQASQLRETVLKLESENQSLVEGMLALDVQIDSLKSQLNILQATSIAARPEAKADIAKTAPKDNSNAEEIIHVVKKGESLLTLAIRYYGRKEEFVRIMKDNNLKNSDHIWIGQRLKIKNHKLNN